MTIRQKDKYGLGANIRSLRLEHNMTQKQVVTEMQLMGIDISREIYSQIECNLHDIKVEQLLALCKIFECDMNAIFQNVEL